MLISLSDASKEPVFTGSDDTLCNFALPDYLCNSGVGRDKFRQHLKTFMFAL